VDPLEAAKNFLRNIPDLIIQYKVALIIIATIIILYLIAKRFLQTIVHLLPEVEIPKRHIPFKEKIIWTIAVLIIYFIMGEIPLYGITQSAQDWFGMLKSVLASEQGTLLHLGIGPIVTAGIFMQLFQGAEMLNFDLTTHEGKALFQGAQKLLAIFLCFFEAFMYAYGGGFGSLSVNILVLMVMQIGFGAFLVMMLDEVVTKWGFGSGISLFIAGGVAKDILWKSLSWTEAKQYPGQLIGAIPSFIQSVIRGEPTFIRGGALPDVTQLLFTIIVFLLVVYFESMRIEIPLSYGRFKGVRGRYPIRFIYASNIPVILAVSMFGSMTLVAKLTFQKLGWTFLGSYDEQGSVRGGLMYYLSPPRSLTTILQEWDRALIYLVVLVAICIVFALLWIEMTNMGPKAVAKQLQQSGMQIPGFRKDIRIVEKVLDRYIPQVTVMGGAAVGLLSAFADFTGALGTGTGILLTVGIVFRMYEDLMREQVSEMFPALRGFLER